MSYRKCLVIAVMVGGLIALGRMTSRAQVPTTQTTTAGSAWAEQFIAKMDGRKNQAIWSKLDEDIREIAADRQSIEKIILFLRDNTETPIFVNWTALTGAGIDRNTPVTLNLHNRSFGTVLSTTLQEAAGGTEQLTYTVADGQVVISTRDDISGPKYQTTQIYDLSDLLPKSQGPEERAHRYIELINAINVAIAPTSQNGYGGALGCMAPFGDQLVVTQTRTNHVAIARLLGKLRDGRQ